MAAVCVYCASGPVPSRYLDLAAELGTALGSSGHTLVSGGGNVSMMGALARSTRAAGGRTVGIIPGHLVDREAADTDSDELIVTETMRERKRLMEARADGFITLPGGIGTLEELFETWTGGFLGEHDKPVVLLDADGFYQPMLRWLDSLHAEGFVSPAALERLLVAGSVADAVTLVTRQ
ncbi:MAG TPA: TIGR00730 family Rossman fold protein [Gordonia sp. (in: high G+C Gram-positive bacteria)]|uniref:LOG family protein n=1 Tax=unclassified Gordonia (in: high G+C Gram-positive bacteria) TaxID=2657482 RepID=UPI000F9CE740|nr:MULTISPECIES: TIGR00730 family Rossman fold protein [unclassified Gordonia (in: high G+C Gram-positive bacteria)]RUP36803.1 MAG: TIGR00730 family Rossman fold protein [Gordonia sp. (in: high G+C Gram-positive bacteria)]HNP58643.1 TIGR00730 family Rossman fold protein [Gordonia sp. (in: high G+C Gram-positive bacteria)]HRC52814.1 TIGR00730 family Rossman fold protein [Gordonia sp. (in: high G+C Gram-positive bacteria)]